MKRILCPTDFSREAANAVSYAAKLAKNIDASVHILHVRLLSDLTPDEALLGAGIDEDLIRNKLDDQCLEVSRVFKISCYPVAPRRGTSLSKEVARAASGFDLVVMGTNGEDGLWQDISGSNTYKVIRETSVPLIMIPGRCGYSDIQHIILAYDYWRTDSGPVDKVVKLAKLLGARITILQVMEAVSKKAEGELQALQKMIREMYPEVALSFETVYDTDIGESINQFVTRSKADVLALCFQPGRFQKMFYTGLVRRMTTETAYPLVVFH
jgi:nucleotide-binding universal stress UspA family protein